MHVTYSCATTMISCTASAVNFGLLVNDTRKLKFWKRIHSRGFWKETGKNFSLRFAALLVPEMAIAYACLEYYTALKDCAIMKNNGFEGWTLQHSFFANMNGFVLGDTYGNHKELSSGLELLVSGVNLGKERCEKIGQLIFELSEENLLLKGFAAYQTSCFLLESIARESRLLPVSPLEYLARTQVFCALMMHIFWFDKPQDVRKKILVKIGRKRTVNKKELKINGIAHTKSNKMSELMYRFEHSDTPDGCCWRMCGNTLWCGRTDLLE